MERKICLHLSVFADDSVDLKPKTSVSVYTHGTNERIGIGTRTLARFFGPRSSPSDSTSST
jgi:hypothetical protein